MSVLTRFFRLRHVPFTPPADLAVSRLDRLDGVGGTRRLPLTERLHRLTAVMAGCVGPDQDADLDVLLSRSDVARHFGPDAVEVVTVLLHGTPHAPSLDDLASVAAELRGDVTRDDRAVTR